MDKDTRNAIERATQRARKLLEDDFASQLTGTFDVLRTGTVAAKAGPHLAPRQVFQRDKIVAAIEHKRAAGMSAAEAVGDYLRDAAFTTLNRFVALKMLEARELVQECISKGEQSSGYREFFGMAPGVPLLPESAGYRLFIESLFDELSTEVKVLFDRRDPASVLWPKRATFEALLEILNATDLAGVWGEDETIGWVYQYFNGGDERQAARYDENGKPKAPQNSRELAVRNQFFTPRYVVQFLTDNSLGRTWYEMHDGETKLAEACEFLIKRPDETFAPRAKKDPRDLRVLDPACGSGHFLLYAFDLLLAIYDEAYRDADSPKSVATGSTLAADYPSIESLQRELPSLILAYNLYGVDIDPRCAQIAQLALWMRAQRAFRDFGIGRAERTQIRRSNIVVAEPLVTDDATTTEFLAQLGDAELGHVFADLVETLQLAGDLGLLLHFEHLLARGPKRGQTGDLFAPPEARIRSALTKFVAASSALAGMRRRLFADDAAQGVGLLETAEKKFDVVLMNPPFGAGSARAKQELESTYARTKNDIYAAFVERGMQLLGSGGYLGAITSGTYFNLSTFSDLRGMLLSEWSARVFVDLGTGVMDDAAVTAACAVVENTSSSKHDIITFVDLRFASDRAALLRRCVGSSAMENPARTLVAAEVIRRLPDRIFAYWLTDGVRQVFARLPALGQHAIATFGLHCRGGDERFYRAWWEVDPSALHESAWPCVFLGGTPQHLYRDSYYVVDWRQDARVLREVARRATGGTFTGKEYYFQPGLTYIYTAQTTFSVQPLPRGSIFTAAAHGLFPGESEDRWAWLAWLNSEPVRLLTKVINPNRFFQASYVRLIPVPDFRAALEELSALAREAVALSLSYVSGDERSRYYCGDWASTCRLDNSESPFAAAVSVAQDIACRLLAIRERINELIITAYQLTDEDLHVLSERIGPSTAQSLPGSVDILAGAAASVAAEHLSALVGVAIGRWDESKLARCLPSFESRDPFEHLPTPPPLRRGGVPLRILVDDEGHPDDIAACVLDALRERWGVTAEATISSLQTVLGGGDIPRRWLATEFFAYHLSRYSFSQSRSPIYWQLATPSASYSVWLYLHAFTKDTLYKVQNDYVAPKLAHEERRLESLRRELGESPKAAERKTLAAQETFVEELRAVLDEVKRVAPLWSPNRDDGVIINFSPLWRLVPHHKPWQKELKTAWDALCAGDYDWAHLAMHLWPERVFPKCATDRSLAIAHGVEDVFWAEGADGKWKARTRPVRPVDELVRERSSPAVKVALKSLLDAPTASGNGRARGRRAGSSAATERGSR